MKGILESLILIGMFVAVVIVLTIADRKRDKKVPENKRRQLK